MRRLLLLTTTALALTACSGASSAEDEPPPTTTEGGEATPGSSFGFDEALAAARLEMPAGIPIEVEHEDVGGRSLLEVELIDGDVVRELYYDPRDGTLARRGDEQLTEDEQAALPALREALSAGEATLERAIEVARQHHDDASLREVELELSDGRPVVQVEIDVGGAAQAHLYDLETGEPVVPSEASRTAPEETTEMEDEEELAQ